MTKEEKAAYNKAYRLANKEKQAAYHKAWRLENPEKKAANDKAYRLANKEKQAAYRLANKEKQAAYRLANKEKQAAYHKAYYLKLNLMNKKISRRTLTAWAVKVKEAVPFCEWCYSEDNLEAHHILPKAKFPQHALDLKNGRTMCSYCHTMIHKQGGF